MHSKIYLFPALMLIFGALVLSPRAWSQAPPKGSTMPGQIEKQFKKAPKLPSRSKGTPAPRIDKRIPKGAEKTRFVLKSLEITGLKVYSRDQLSPFFESMIGREVSLREIFELAETLTAKYRADGYIVSRVIVPAQSIESGKVVLQAVEGFIAEITIVGLPDGRAKFVRSFIEKIKGVRPLTAAVLERYMLLVNDLPGIFARATMAPSKTVFGAADLTVHVTQSRLSTGLGFDNRGGRALGPGRISANMEVYNVLGLHERTAILVATSLDEELRFYSLQHEEQIGSEGGKVLLGASFVRAKPEDLSQIVLNIETKSDAYFLTYSHPVLRSRTQNINLRATFSTHDGESELLGIKLSEDHLRVVRFGFGYDLVDSFGGVNLVNLELSRGIDGLGSSENGDATLSRADGKVDFTKATFYAARSQDMAPHWSLLAALNGQYAFDDLLTSELYGFGGEPFGRGYDPSEFVGDNGLAAKFELRYDDDITTKILLSYTAYGFYDVGWIWQRSGGSLGNARPVASAGLGLRFNLGSNLSGFVEAAKPITSDVAAEGNRDLRGYLGLTVSF